jgi:hypothetical protein
MEGTTSNNSSKTLDEDYVSKQTTRAVSKQAKQTHSPNKKMSLKDDPLQAFYKQDNYFKEILESKKDQNKSFVDVMKSIKRKKQDDNEEETPLKKGGKANISMKDIYDISNTPDPPDTFEYIVGITEVQPDLLSGNHGITGMIRPSLPHTGIDPISRTTVISTWSYFSDH